MSLDQHDGPSNNGVLHNKELEISELGKIENLNSDNEKLIISLNEMNRYSDLKSYAKSGVDIALLTANANQLKYFLNSEGPSRIPTITLVSISISLQVSIWNDKSILCEHKILINAFLL